MDSKGRDTRRTVLITGSTGFIGRHLIEYLLDDELFASSLRPVAFVRATSDCSAFPKDLEIRIGSLSDEASLYRALEGIDYVVHLAAYMDFYPKNSEPLIRINVNGTRNLLEASSKRRISMFIYVSSTETIGPSPEDGSQATETSPCNPSYAYGKSKILAEQEVQRYGLEKELPFYILRPTGVYGPKDRFTIYELMCMIQNGLMFFVAGSGSAKLMYTHVSDVVQGIGCCLEKGYPPLLRKRDDPNRFTYIISPDQALTYKQWIELLAEHLGRAKPKIHLPLWFVKFTIRLMAPFFNWGKSRVFMFQPKTIDRMVENRTYSNEKAKKELKYVSRYPLEKGLAMTVQANLKSGALKRYPISPVGLSLLGLFFMGSLWWLWNSSYFSF